MAQYYLTNFVLQAHTGMGKTYIVTRKWREGPCLCHCVMVATDLLTV